MPLLLLLTVFIVVPLAELYVILKVGDAIGIVWTILLLAADSILGSVLLKTQGRAVWRRFNAELDRGRMPHRDVIDGVLVIFGGAFLITPGFITDLVGVLLLLPPTRSVIRGIVVRRLGKRFVTSVAGRRTAPPRDYDVEGHATEYEPPPPRRLGR
jgi:UPF0716 protein FxsA